MKQILLTRGQVALVDDLDYDKLSKYKWHAQRNDSGGGYYARRSVSFEGLYDTDPSRLGKKRRLFVSMARQICGLCSEDPCVPDHKNRDSLDNQRHNLRVCTKQQNSQNQTRRTGGVSKYRGVTRHVSKWVVAIQGEYLGLYEDEKVAAKVYDAAAKARYGEFAPEPNFPTEESC